MSIKQVLRKFLANEDGPTAVEYAVLLALILAVIIGGITTVGGGTNGWWNKTNTELSTYGF